MATFTKTLVRALAALCLSLSPGEGYEFLANCVPGDIVKDLAQTQGKVGLYVMALQKIVPLYGNLKLMAEGPGDECGEAATLVNVNQIRPQEIVTKFTNMTEVGALQSLKTAVSNRSYLYVFKNKNYREYHAIADCVPGPIVKGLNQTGGRIALYTVALTTILPGLFGDLLFLGEGNNSECINMMNNINEGNDPHRHENVMKDVKAKKSKFGMKEIGVLQGLKLAEDNMSYLYVFKNKMWNNTWSVMLPGLKDYGVAI